MNIIEIRNELEGRVRHLAENEGCQDNYRLHIYFKMICDVILFYKQFYDLDLSDLFTLLISSQKNQPDMLTVAALELKHRGHLEAARILLDRAGELGRAIPYTRAMVAEMLREQGRRGEARQRCTDLLQEFPNLLDANSCLVMCDVDELLTSHYDYYQILDHAHRLLKPESYIEIGVSTGKSLALARTGTSAVGIDPNAANSANHFFHSLETEPRLFPMTSNDFFKSTDLTSLFGTPTFEMAFIDGLHVFEQALMDFIHLEKLSHKDSVIFIHDCLPVNALTAERERQTGFWTGDVWRVIPCLKAIRPNLEIVTFPSSPSGLAMVTGLDSTSRIMSQQFDSIVAHFLTVPLPESFAERCELLNVTTIDPVKFMEQRFTSVAGR